MLGAAPEEGPGWLPDVSLPTFQGPPGPRPAHIYVSVSVDFPSSPAGQQVASHHPSVRQMTCPRSGSEREGLQTPRPGSLHSPLCMEAPPSWAHLETLLQGTSCHQIPGPVPNPQPQGPHSSSGPGPRPPLPGASGFTGAQDHSAFHSIHHHRSALHVTLYWHPHQAPSFIAPALQLHQLRPREMKPQSSGVTLPKVLWVRMAF